MTDRDPTTLPVVQVWTNQGDHWQLEGEVAEYETLEFTPTFNDLGSWTLTTSYDNEQAPLLQKGDLVTIDWRGRRSTWTIEPHTFSDETTGELNLEVTGVGALDHLGWDLAWPDPTKGLNDQPVTATSTGGGGAILLDTDGTPYVSTGTGTTSSSPAPYSGPAETVIKRLVSGNYGSTSPSGVTRSIAVPTTAGLGSVVPANPQIDNLLETVTNLAKLGGVGVDVGLVNVGGPNSTRAKLTLLVWQPVDRSKEILLTQDAGTLASWSQTETAPTATMAVVAGGGTGGVDRIRQIVTTPASEAAAAAWGGHRVVFVDGPSSFDPAELTAAGEQALLDGAATITLTLTSSESAGQLAFWDFYNGDKAAGQAIKGAVPVVEPISSIGVSVGIDEGITVTPTFGNPDVNDPQTDLSGQVRVLKQYIRRLQTRT